MLHLKYQCKNTLQTATGGIYTGLLPITATQQANRPRGFNMAHNTRNTNSTNNAPATVQAPAPATVQAPVVHGPAVTKYTRAMLAHGGTITGVVAGNAQSLYVTQHNGKSIFTLPVNAVCKAKGPAMHTSPGYFNHTVITACMGNTPAVAIANIVMFSVNGGMGRVPGCYHNSYYACAAYLLGNGPHPGSSHVNNLAQHIWGYIKPGKSSWLYSTSHGNAHWVV